MSSDQTSKRRNRDLDIEDLDADGEDIKGGFWSMHKCRPCPTGQILELRGDECFCVPDCNAS